MRRCFDLAVRGLGKVSPNPLVGAVIVYNQRVIGEGFHMNYGKAHAEVNAINSVRPEDRQYLKESTIYINLEPCCIHGKTPPCTDLIIRNKIPKVVFSCLDHTSGVQGKSIKILEAAGCEVTTGVLQKQGKQLIHNRTIFTSQNRPYIILKYAQSSDGFIGKENQSIWLTNPISKRLVHKWRSEIDAILVGTNTAAIDNPKLTNRYYAGSSPLRIVLDRELKLKKDLFLFDQSQETWVITEIKNVSSFKQLTYHTILFDEHLISNLLNLLVKNNYSNLMVEGGKKLLDSFISLGLWDEARVFEAATPLFEGISAPTLHAQPKHIYSVDTDRLNLYIK